MIDFILHIDVHLAALMASYGIWVYALLFLILFIETGLVVMPFLPGDSLIFAAGALAAVTMRSTTGGQMNIWVLVAILPLAAVAGDAMNFEIGKNFGERLLSRFEGRIINRKHIADTEAFFERHGGKTILLARFVPFVRTFAPFVAGIGRMHYGRFARFNVVGGLLWAWGFLFLGFFFGNIPFVKNNFEFVIIGIVLISVIPMFVQFIINKLKARRNAA
ncbi:MAG: DedA family protein [Actinomycetia bacterium]|nr:DedA family protein [Actinomycetes bacterium]